jgi:hypothetical protein
MSGEQVSSTMAWIQIILPSIGLSAAVGGAVSAIVNYRMNIYTARKKDEMSLISEKIHLYAFIISRLDEMKFVDNAIALHEGKSPDPDGFSYDTEKWGQLIQEIDDRIRDGYYLLKRQIYEKWVTVKTLHGYPESKKVLPELREMLTDEYNRIITKHLKHIKGDIISEISPDKPVLDFTRPKGNNDQQPSTSS